MPTRGALRGHRKTWIMHNYLTSFRSPGGGLLDHCTSCMALVRSHSASHCTGRPPSRGRCWCAWPSRRPNSRRVRLLGGVRHVLQVYNTFQCWTCVLAHRTCCTSSAMLVPPCPLWPDAARSMEDTCA